MVRGIFNGFLGRNRLSLSARAKRRSQTRRRINVESLEERRLMVADLVNFVTDEHVDINIMHNGASWSIGPRNSDASPNIQFENDEVVMYVGSPAVTARPAATTFDFIGVGAGQDFYLLPQLQNTEVLYAGFAGYGVNASGLDSYQASAESKGRVSGNTKWIKASLTDVRHTLPDGEEGNGAFSIWQTGSFGGATVFVSSYNDLVSNPNGSGLDVTDGVSSDDAIWMIAGGHTHYNFGFTQPGRYEVDLRASAYFGDDGLTTPNAAGFSQSGNITLYFSVMSVGQLQIEESSYSVNEDAGTISVDVIRTGGSDGRLVVDYETSNGTALEPGDYTETIGSLEFLDGEVRKTIVIPIVNDSEQEGDEIFSLSLIEPAPINLDDYITAIEEDANGLLGSISTATITILGNDNIADLLQLQDDSYEFSRHELLYGYVLSNDSIDESLGAVTVSVDSAPSQGVVTLESNGSFSYEPFSTFAGSDSFVYSVQTAAGPSASATVTIGRGAVPEFAAVLSEGHADIGVNFADDAWDLHVHDEENDIEYLSAEALLHVGPEALTTRSGDAALPVYDFLGVVPDESFYVLPEVENPALLFLGIGAEELASGLLESDILQLELYSVSGPGHFSLWQSGLTPNAPELRMATADGIDSMDQYTVFAGGHAHANFGFTEAGLYAITFVARAVSPVGDSLVSAPTTYYFFVGDAAKDDAYSVSGQSAVRGSVIANDDLIQALGPMATTVEVMPTKGTLTLEQNGAFAYQPNTMFDGSDSFVYKLANAQGGFTTASVSIVQGDIPLFAATLTEGHADIGVNFAEDTWDLHIHDEENDIEYEPGEALLVVGPDALTLRTGDSALPAYDFLGVAVNEPFFVLPAVENPALLFLGIGGEELAAGLLDGDSVQLELYSVSGPGYFSLWQSGLTPDAPQLRMATSDGIDGSDSYTVLAGGHAHANFGFSQAGVYEITLRARANALDGSQLVSEPVTYYFRVGGAAAGLSEVIASGTNWNPTFIDTIDGGGAGAGNGVGLQLTSSMPSIPWQGMNRLQLQFSENVTGVSASTIELRDSNGPLPITVSYDSETFIATIEIGVPLTFSKLRLAVSDLVTDSLGIPLDGNNDGLPGELFNLRFDVLVGDADADGRVNGADLPGFAQSFNATAGQANFNPRANWNGDDRVNGADLTLFAGNFNKVISSLAEPGAPFGGNGGGSGFASNHDYFFESLAKEEEDEKLGRKGPRARR